MTEEARRAAVRTAYDGRCGYCAVHESEAGAELEIDHFQPRSAGGGDDLDNLIEWVRAAPLLWPAYEGEWMVKHNYAGPEQMVELVEFMLDHGYPESAILGILGGNWERVCGEVWT